MTTTIQKIPKGYKNTELGIIPEDWNVKRLGEVLKVMHGKSQRNVETIDGKYPILATGGEIGRTNYYLYDKPSVMIGRKGTIDKPQYIESPFWTVDTLFYSDIFNNVVPRYIFYLFHAIDWYSHNEASGVPSLNAKTIENIKITIPATIKEQKDIVDVLLDTDMLIGNLEKLIIKKKVIKHGTMQQLLTGKKRLPGFDGEWEEKQLIEIANFFDNLRIPVTESKRENGATPYYGANGIQGYVKGYTHDGEFVLIAEDGANDLNNYPVLYVNGKVWVNNHTHVIQGINKKAKTKYLSYALKAISFVQVLVGGTRVKLNGSVAKAIKIIIPVDISEQTAIATVLSDMDAEIEKLESQLAKYQDIKQGIMQQLLTGKIRLI